MDFGQIAEMFGPRKFRPQLDVRNKPRNPFNPQAAIQQLAALLQAKESGGSPQGSQLAQSLGPTGGAADVALSGSGAGAFTMGGGPEAHGSRALGNWQSDTAYDLMGRGGQAVYAPATGRVVKISGQPGGSPQFAGYGITVSTNQGNLFFKHLGSKNVAQGARIRPGQLIGTLDPSVQGGPHLHLGGQNRAFLDRLAKFYT